MSYTHKFMNCRKIPNILLLQKPSMVCEGHSALIRLPISFQMFIEII